MEKQAAFDFVTQKFNVLPVAFKTKGRVPFAWAEWQENKFPHERLKMYWSAAKGELNLAIVCGKTSGGLAVVDFDSQDAFDKYKAKLPATWLVKTNRGHHAYYFCPDAECWNGDGVDVKAQGGLIMAPPSVHPSGEVYEWVEETLSLPIATILWSELSAVLGVRRGGKDISLVLAGVPAGERNDSCFDLSLKLFRAGFSKSAALRVVELWNEKNKPPLDAAELVSTFESAYSGRYGKSRAAARFSNADKFFDGNRFMPAWVGDLLWSEGFYYTDPVTHETFVYRDGVWVNSDAFLRHRVKNLLGEESRSNRVNEVLFDVKCRSYAESIIDPPPNLVCIQNGVLDVDSLVLSPHSAMYFFQNKLPVSWDEKAECPMIDNFLEEVSAGESEVLMLKEFVGYCFYRALPIHRSFALLGPGANGKSTFLKLVQDLLGAENISSRSLYELENNRFALGDLRGKLANVHADLSAGTLQGTGKFKMLVGADLIGFEKKYQHAGTYMNYAKLIFSAQSLPITKDDTKAFFRRWVLINFPNVFEGDAADKHLREKLKKKEELNGFFKESVFALRGLLARGDFCAAKGSDEVAVQYLEASNPVGAFARQFLEEDPSGVVAKDEVYRAYCDYCQGKNFAVRRYDGFFRFLKDFLPIGSALRREDGRNFITGIKLKKGGLE